MASRSTPIGPHLHLTARLRDICVSMVACLPDFAHIDMHRVAVGFCQARKNVKHGLQATLTPLRFEGGATVRQTGKRKYTCQRVMGLEGQECPYLLNFYVPRFLNLSHREKLATIVHELWHIGPQFDGDLRRHGGRYHVHGPSQEAYDEHADRLAQQWLATGPPANLHEWLAADFGDLIARHGRIVGDRYPAPRLIRLPA